MTLPSTFMIPPRTLFHHRRPLEGRSGHRPSRGHCDWSRTAIGPGGYCILPFMPFLPMCSFIIFMCSPIVFI